MNSLADLLSSRVKAEVFRLLFGPSAQELHLREIARRSGMADATVRQELTKLTRIGLVESRRDGNRLYYQSNRHHPLYAEIRSIVRKTSGLVDVLKVALVDPGIRVAFVFGSVAAGTEQAHSDVDVMIVGNLTLRQVSRFLSGVGADLGREVNPHVMTADEFQQRKKGRDHFLSTVLEAPRLFITGSEDDLRAMGR